MQSFCQFNETDKFFLKSNCDSFFFLQEIFQWIFCGASLVISSSKCADILALIEEIFNNSITRVIL